MTPSIRRVERFDPERESWQYAGMAVIRSTEADANEVMHRVAAYLEIRQGNLARGPVNPHTRHELDEVTRTLRDVRSLLKSA